MRVSDQLRDAFKARGFLQLWQELNAAGVPLNLQLEGNDLRTVNGDGSLVELPSAAQAVVTNHVPSAPIDYGVNAEDLDRSKIQAFVSASNTFLGNATPSNAQVLAQEQRNTKALLTLIKLVRGTNG